MRTRTLLITLLTAMLYVVGAGPAQAATLGGVTSIQSSVDAEQAGKAEAFSFSADASGTAASISLYVDSRNRATTAHAGLYTDALGEPGTLLTRGSLPSPRGDAWNTIAVPPAAIVAGRSYWLAVLGTGGAIYFRDVTSSTGCKSKSAQQATLTSLPSFWTTGATYDTCSVSAYVSGTASVAPPPPPTAAAPPSASYSHLPAAPTASFTFTPGSPVTGQATTFDASGSSCPATPCTYSWQDDGPDGAGGTQWPLGTGKTMSFTFSSAGDKIVRLTVTDAQARSSAAVRRIAVAAPSTPPPAPGPAPTPTPSPPTCNRSATSAATLSTQFSAAASGETICLAAGNYGVFAGGAKSGMVTIRPQTGATASISAQFSGVSNVTLDGMTVTNLRFNRSVRHVTVRNSRFTGFAYIDAAGMLDAAILLDNNTHIDINMTSLSTPPGRVHVDAGQVNRGTRSGIVVRNSLFKGGTSDGVRADGGASIVIEGNEFTAIRDVDPYHADAIQFYGGQNVTIRGNYFHDQTVAASCSLGQHDGGGGHLIERNVIVGGNCYYGMYLRDDSSSIVRNNTFAYGSCLSNIACGQIVIDGKSSPGSGTLFRNNIFTGLSNRGAFVSQYTADHNLTRQAILGTANIIGTPVFVGGANPTSYAGFKLAAGSPGKNAGADGRDIGI